MAEEGKSPARPFLSRIQRGDGRPGEFRKWITASWPTLVMLFFIFVLALFVRAYFGYPTAHDNGNLVSGGSDSYYWERIINYSAQTGQQLYHDPLLNFPEGIRNPRPPMFSMAVVVEGVLTQSGFPSLNEALGWYLLWTPAFWGAITIVPTYLLGKETFGKRAGLVAAFFLAVMPSHVQRSVLSDADHDSFILFFIVLMLFFLLKALKVQQTRKYVERWSSPSSIRAGIADYLRTNRAALLYASLAGVAYGAVIMTWVGFGYVTVLVLIIYVVQVLLNKIKAIDSMSVTMIIGVTMAVGFFLSFPMYYYQSLLATRFDVPLYLFIASIGFGTIFVITRDLPWTVTFPAIGILLVVILGAISIVNPALAQNMLTGEGYFSTSKLYSTIAEAKAPVFSELALGFGMITFFLSLVGLAWAVIKIPKNTTAQYIFITVWLVEAIFMAMTSARFMFNATPAFAIAAGWIAVIIVDKLDFNTVRKTLMGASGSYFQVIKKSVKVRHVLGALFLAFMVVLPNVWYSIDAGVPSETKTHLDREIYDSLPSILRPSGYDVKNGSNYFLGAFGYSLPLPTQYFPAAWSWFASRDINDTPASTKPAFVAWWDYGFEAIAAGLHPSVADNFQNGYQITGNAIVAQSESDAIAIFAYRIIGVAVSKGGSLETGTYNILEKYGLNTTDMRDILQGPAEPIIKRVLSDPSIYGPMSSDLDSVNARIVAARVALTSIGTENLVNLYGDLVDFTVWNIRYFMVDSRMFPSSGTNTGIFYAPAKLGDRRISTVTGSPIDFYEVEAVTTAGQTVAIENLTAQDTIADYKIVYKDMFYKSMFYRAFTGFTGAEIGLSNDGIPGLSGSTQNYQAMPGWNLTHFMQVYRTAYYNPFPVAQLSEHRDAWTAMGWDQAEALKAQINAGTATGVVDDSAYTFYSAGAVFLEYYKGAYVNGTVTTEQGYPVGGIRATIQDKYGIPHESVATDANGHYSLLAPPGQDTLVLSSGAATNQNMVGGIEIKKMVFNVTDDMAMRVHQDLNNDGVLDYIITKDFAMVGTKVSGTIFWDVNHDKNFTEGTDILFTGSRTVAREQFTNKTFDLDSANGTFQYNLPSGRYDFNVLVNDEVMSMGTNVNATAGGSLSVKLPIESGAIGGYALYANGTVASNITLKMIDLEVNHTYYSNTSSIGEYSFSLLVPGNYTMATDSASLTIFDINFAVQGNSSITQNITVERVASINYVAFIGTATVAYPTWIITNVFDPSVSVSGVGDKFGQIRLVDVPKGLWNLYVTYHTGTSNYAGATLVDSRTASSATGIVSLQPAVKVNALVTISPTEVWVAGEFVNFEMANGARISIATSANGALTAWMPLGTYNVTIISAKNNQAFSDLVTVTAKKTSFSFMLTSAVKLSGDLVMVRDAVAGISSGDTGRFGDLIVKDASGRTFLARADIKGVFSTVVPSGQQLTISLGNPGYAGWSTKVTLTQSISGYTIVARPDNVTVSGVVTNNSIGIRGITVAFLPSSFLGSPVYAVTGPGGVYTASVPASLYSIVVNQNADLMGAERYAATLQERFLPTGETQPLDVQVVKKVGLSGSLTGGSTTTQLVFRGPEDKTITATGLNYSVYLLPGHYSLYAASASLGTTYANISSFDITPFARQHSIQLTQAHALQGVASTSTAQSDNTVNVLVTSSTGAFTNTTSTDMGFYSFELPAGSYEVKFSRQDTLAVGAYTLSVEYFAQANITIGNFDMTLSPDLVLRLDNATLSGTCLGPDGQPEAATITLIPNSRLGQPTSFMTDGNGAFNQSVQPGDYTIYATNQVDRTSTISRVVLLRKVETQGTIPMQSSNYLSINAKVAGTGAHVTFAILNGSSKLQLDTDSQGNLQVLLPPGSYTVSSTTFRTEHGLNVTYSINRAVSMGSSPVFQVLDLVRGTSRTLATSWPRTAEQRAAPGEQVNYVMTIANTGNIADTYLISYTGTGFNVSFSSTSVNLDFAINNQTTVSAHITPTSSVSAGEQSVPISVRSNSLATVRSSLALYVNVTPVHAVSIKNLNSSAVVNSLNTTTKFNLSNAGNIGDKFILMISNAEQLRSLGWGAVIFDPSTGSNSTNVTLLAFSTVTLEVKFTSLRADADPTAKALVLAYAENATYASMTTPIPIILPDLALSPGTLRATNPDVTYAYDQGPLYLDIALLVVIAALLVMFFILRKRKGFGGAKK